MSIEGRAALFLEMTQGSRLLSTYGSAMFNLDLHGHLGRREIVERHAGDFVVRPGSVPKQSHQHFIARNLGIGTQLNCK